MAVAVIALEQTLAPATESVLDRNHHAVVVGNSFCVELLHSAESRVRRAVWNWIGASPCRQGAKAPRICAGIHHEFVDSMMAKVAYAERRVRSKRLLYLQTPSLILRFVRVLFGDVYLRRKEVGY